MAYELSASWSEIDAYRQCAYKHQLSYLERWSELVESPRLHRGTVWHKALEIWHGRAHKEGDAERAIKQIEDLFARETGDECELLRWMFEGYLLKWGIDHEWRTRGVEINDEFVFPAPAGVEILVDWDGVEVKVWLKVKIDLIVSTQGIGPTQRLWVVDHKAESSLATDKLLELQDQFGLYLWVMRAAGMNTHGVIYNGALTKRNKKKPQTLESRFVRIQTVRGKRELDEIARDAYISIRDAWQPYLLQGAEYRAGRSPDSDRCRWRCPYLTPCLASRQGIDPKPILASQFKQSGYSGLREIDG